MIGFYEKSPDPPGNIANGALYVFNDDFLDHLESIQPRPEDFSLDVIPTLMRRINTWCTDSIFRHWYTLFLELFAIPGGIVHIDLSDFDVNSARYLNQLNNCFSSEVLACKIACPRSS